MKYLLTKDGTDHTHTVTLDARGNGVSSFDAGHSHAVKSKIVEKEFGHSHSLAPVEAFGDFGYLSENARRAIIGFGILILAFILLGGNKRKLN